MDIEDTTRSELSKKLCYESFIAEASLEPVSRESGDFECRLDGQCCSLDKLRLSWMLSAM